MPESDSYLNDEDEFADNDDEENIAEEEVIDLSPRQLNEVKKVFRFMRKNGGKKWRDKVLEAYERLVLSRDDLIFSEQSRRDLNDLYFKEILQTQDGRSMKAELTRVRDEHLIETIGVILPEFLLGKLFSGPKYTIWKDSENVSNSTGQNFEIFMGAINETPIWNVIKKKAQLQN